MKQPESPTFEEHGWELESAEDRHAQAPDTFLIPDQEERTSLKIDQRVQLLFLFIVAAPDGTPEFQCEKMWVTIDVASDGSYQGTLDSCPASSKAVSPGDVISFGPQHVVSVVIPNPDPRHPDGALRRWPSFPRLWLDPAHRQIPETLKRGQNKSGSRKGHRGSRGGTGRTKG